MCSICVVVIVVSAAAVDDDWLIIIIIMAVVLYSAPSGLPTQKLPIHPPEMMITMMTKTAIEEVKIR